LLTNRLTVLRQKNWSTVSEMQSHLANVSAFTSCTHPLTL
jgi:hypothetical protein